MELGALGSKLAQLIEEGKKALGREIVVMSERPEDEFDDGTGGWVDDGPAQASAPTSPPSAHGSLRRSVKRRPRSLAPGPPSYPGSPEPLMSPRKSRYDPASVRLPVTPSRRDPRNTSVESTRSTASAQEDESEWQSPQLREFMERARASRLGR